MDDADAIAVRAATLGGKVLVAPFDAPWVRMTVLSDPQGAVFTASTLRRRRSDAPELSTSGSDYSWGTADISMWMKDHWWPSRSRKPRMYM